MLKFTKISIKIQKKLTKILEDNTDVCSIIHAIDAVGGKIYLVGGAVGG